MIAIAMLAAAMVATPATHPDAELPSDRYRQMTTELSKLRTSWPENVEARAIAEQIKQINDEAAADAIDVKAAAKRQMSKARRASTRREIGEKWGDERREASAQRQQQISELRRIAAIIDAAERADRLTAEAEIYVRFGQLDKASKMLPTAARGVADGVEVVQAATPADAKTRGKQLREWQAGRIKGYFAHWDAIRRHSPEFATEILVRVDHDHRAAWSKLHVADHELRRAFARGMGMLWLDLRAGGLDDAEKKIADHWVEQTKGEHTDVRRAAETRPSGIKAR